MFNKIFNGRNYTKYRFHILLFIDLCIVVTGYFIAYLIKNDFANGVGLWKNLFDLKVIIGGIVIILIHLFFFYIFRVQRSLWTYIGSKELGNISIAVASAVACIELLIWGLNTETTFIGTVAIAGFIIIVLMLCSRVTYRSLRDYNKNRKNSAHNFRKAIIIGAGDAGYILMKELQKNNQFRAKLVGFVDDNRAGMIVSGYSVLGTINDLPSIVVNRKIEVVFIAIPSASVSTRKRVIELCKVLNVETKIMRAGETLVEDSSRKQIKDISIEDLLGRGVMHLESDQIREYIENETVLVTGAAGSIGGQLCQEIFKFKPKCMLLLDVNENGLYMLEQEFMRLKRENQQYQNIKVVSLIVSIREKDALNSIFEEYNIDVVYHAAAHKHVPLMEERPQEAIKNNIVGTMNVIDTAIAHKVKRVIMISTDKAVNPTNVMGASKRMTELILQSRGEDSDTKIAAVRFGNVLGSNGSVIPIFKRQIESGGPLTLTSKKIIRYFMTIPEAAQLVLQAGYYASKGEIFVLDMGEPVRILDLAENLIRLSGFEPYKDIDIVEIGLRPGEKMFEELQYSQEKTYRTENDMITVNEIIPVDKQKVNEVVAYLENLAHDQTVSKDRLKKELFDAIKMERVIK